MQVAEPATAAPGPDTFQHNRVVLEFMCVFFTHMLQDECLLSGLPTRDPARDDFGIPHDRRGRSRAPVHTTPRAVAPSVVTACCGRRGAGCGGRRGVDCGSLGGLLALHQCVMMQSDCTRQRAECRL